MRIPDGVAWLADDPSGAAWISRLGRLVREVAELWDIEIDDDRPFAGSRVSWAAPARWGDEDLVVKIQWPHPESEHEAAALARWDGDGAVRLVAQDRARRALLVERCRPGHPLDADTSPDPLGVLIGLLPRLWVPVDDPFAALADEAQGWADGLVASWEAARRPCERRLVDAALDAIASLAPTQPESVLIHQDLHGANVLAAGRAPWLVIDPKPVAGERAAGLAPIIRSAELGREPDAAVTRLHRLSAELGVDRERARGWAVAQITAWSFSSPDRDRHHQVVRDLLADAP